MCREYCWPCGGDWACGVGSDTRLERQAETRCPEFAEGAWASPSSQREPLEDFFFLFFFFFFEPLVDFKPASGVDILGNLCRWFRQPGEDGFEE